MKKVILSVLLIAVLVVGVFTLTGCNNDKAVTIEKVELNVVKNASFKVGDAFNGANFEVKVYLSDETTKVVTNNFSLRYHKENLSLDANNCYSKAGEATLKVDFLDYKNISVTFTIKA